MLNTRLILVEGPSGSGKTTTAGKLVESVTASGWAASVFGSGVQTIRFRLVTTCILTRSLAPPSPAKVMYTHYGGVLCRRAVTVFESRFWQTSLMLMYIAGQPLDGLLESNQRVVEIIQPLNPVLIH